MNLRRVDARIIRSDQPNPDAWPLFRELGTEVVICLRQDGEADFWLDAEKGAVLGAGMEFVSIPVGEMPWNKPTKAQVETAIGIMQGQPCLVHCRRGCDRTGLFVACYRMATGMGKEKAIAEALACGMSRLEVAMREFLEGWNVQAVAQGGAQC